MSGIEFRSHDGSGNNLANPDWGRAGSRLLRLTTPAYVGRSGLAGPDSPNPRVVSNTVCRQPGGSGKPSPARLSDYIWAWGQFLDHEPDLLRVATHGRGIWELKIPRDNS